MFTAHRLVYHSTLGWRVIKKKKKYTVWLAAICIGCSSSRSPGAGEEEVRDSRRESKDGAFRTRTRERKGGGRGGHLVSTSAPALINSLPGCHPI